MEKVSILRYYLYFFAVMNIFIIPVIAVIYGDMILWHPRNIPTEMMMNAIYIAMGIGMLRIAKNPQNHKAFIDFIIISSIFHALVMLYYAEHIFHIGDALILAAMGIIPLIVYPWGLKTFLSYNTVKK